MDSSTSERSSAAAHHTRLPRAGWLRDRIGALQRLELQVVGAQRRLSDLLPLRAVVRLANWLGDGWLYLLLAAALLLDGRPHATAVLASAATAVVLAHAVYPWIKNRIARPRPYTLAPHLRPYLRTLDRYSFPSGHCMTATAAALPLAQGYPEFGWLVASSWALIAWARVACAHHYPSDLLAGAALGLLAAAVGSELALVLPGVRGLG